MSRKSQFGRFRKPLPYLRALQLRPIPVDHPGVALSPVTQRLDQGIASEPAQSRLRALLALREFVLGNLTLDAATHLAGMSGPDLLSLLDDFDVGDDPDDADDMDRPRISVVVPVFNEEENLPVLHARLSKILEGLGTYEIVFVDDGSRDRSAEIALKLQQDDRSVRLLRFSRNFGHQAALSAGIDHARGDAVILMDADLQDPPEVLPDLVRQWESGHHVVYAIRSKRDEGMFKRSTAAIFYRLLRAVADIDIPVDAGDFCLLDRKVVEALRSLPEKNRFLRGLRSWVGFSQVGVSYERPARHAGETKYGLRKMVKLAVDAVLSFTSMPLRLASVLGFATAAAGAAYIAFALAVRLLGGHLASGWMTLVALILIVGGIQLIMTGVLGSYIARIYEETKRRPMYVIEQAFETARGSRRG